MGRTLFPLILVALCASQPRVSADVFGTDASAFAIDFVQVGNPGNPPDLPPSSAPFPSGVVDTAYRIGKYEISERMFRKANDAGGLGFLDAGNPESNKPATRVSWNEAARFVNWLNVSTGGVPAYKFALQPGDTGYDVNDNILTWSPADAGYDAANVYRNSLARYFLPSAKEWHKAAYYDPANGVYHNYPTGSDAPPLPVASGDQPGTAVYGQPFAAGPAEVTLAGGLSPYGTMGQGGNVYEWEETDVDLLNGGQTSDGRGKRGGAWTGISFGLSSSSRGFGGTQVQTAGDTGFRVASRVVPEPHSQLLLVLGSLVISLQRTKPRVAR